MSIPAAWTQCLDFFGTPLIIEPSPGQRKGLEAHGRQPSGEGFE
jgi:hypothetical protein